MNTAESHSRFCCGDFADPEKLACCTPLTRGCGAQGSEQRRSHTGGWIKGRARYTIYSANKGDRCPSDREPHFLRRTRTLGGRDQKWGIGLLHTGPLTSRLLLRLLEGHPRVESLSVIGDLDQADERCLWLRFDNTVPRSTWCAVPIREKRSRPGRATPTSE